MLIAIERTGKEDPDKDKHQGVFDIRSIHGIPNMNNMKPNYENVCRQMLYTGYQCEKDATLRYPR